MGRSARKRIAKGVYWDEASLTAYVGVGSGPDHPEQTKTYPHGTSLREIQDWQDDTRVELRKLWKQQKRQRGKGTLADDVQRYLALVSAMPTFEERKKQLEQWVAALPAGILRAKLTPAEIAHVLEDWRTTRGWSASTLNHHRTALAHIWSRLDGKGAPNPVRSVPRYREPDAEPRGVDYATIRRILRAMPPSRTRLRLALIAYTGIPHATLGRVTPEDLDLSTGILARPGRHKGAGTERQLIPMGRRGRRIWRLFDAAGAYGPFSASAMYQSFGRALTKLKLEGIRPYDLRHSYLTQVYLATGDLAVTAEAGGHRSLTTTRRYTKAAVPAALARAVALAEGKCLTPALDTTRRPGRDSS